MTASKKIVAALWASAIGILLFMVSLVAAVRTYAFIYRTDAVDESAGAQMAGMVIALGVALPVGVLAFAVTFVLLLKRYRLSARTT